MEQPKKFIKKYLGEISLTGGIGLFIYNIFNFSYETTTGSCFNIDIDLFDCDTELIEGVAYYYQSDTITMISIGAMLIIIGILIIKNK